MRRLTKEEYETRKKIIKRLRAAAGEHLEKIRRQPNRPQHDPEYQKAVRRYTEIQNVLQEFIRHNIASHHGGARILFGLPSKNVRN